MKNQKQMNWLGVPDKYFADIPPRTLRHSAGTGCGLRFVS